MKAKNVQGIICLVILFLFANQAWASDWILLASLNVGDIYYDKRSIKKLNNNITHVWCKLIFNKKGKTEIFSALKDIDKTPDNPDILNCELFLREIDCVNEKTKIISTTIYDEKGDTVLLPQNNVNEWHDIVPGSLTETLKNIVCSGGKTSKTKKK